MKRGIVFIILFSILLISSVSALNACCEKTKTDDWCVYTDEENCDPNSQYTYSACGQTSYCQMGCCYTSEEGRCYKNTAKAACDAEDRTTWSSSPDCDIEQCNLGCCVLADQAFYVTEVRCKAEASQFESVSMSFDESIESERDCLNSVKSLDWGCCVTDDVCEYTTRQECGASEEVGVNFTEQGFQEGMLCSNDLLSCDCAKQQTTGCYEGKVYWYDSCGNRENIYSSDDRGSYNGGYELSETESCSWTSGADSSSCGNCDYAKGGTCGSDTENVMEVGEVTCVDLNCDDTFENDYSPQAGGDKLNGESWCIYDGEVGMGLDRVGSRHYRHVCINGEEITEPCSDFREEICIHGVLSEDVLGNLEAINLDSSNDYVEAACRANRADDCFACNDVDTYGTTERSWECCVDEDMRDCFWLPYDESATSTIDDVANGTCVAQVPVGSKFWDESGGDTCSAASTECSVTYRMGGWSGLWTKLTKEQKKEKYELILEEPYGCRSREWLVEQNTYCRSLGDCGAFYNFIDEPGYDGFESTMFDEEFFFDYDELDADDLIDNYYSQNYEKNFDDKFFNSQDWYRNPEFLLGVGTFVAGGVLGAFGCEAEADAEAAKKMGKADAKKEEDPEDPPETSDDTVTPNEAPENPMYGTDNPGQTFQSGLSSIQSLGNINFGQGLGCFFSRGALGLFTTGNLNKKIGTADMIATTAETLGDFGAQYQQSAQQAKGLGRASKLLNVATLVIATDLLVQYAFENETTWSYSVDCNSWQPPKGGDNCEVCNDGDMPCSEYRCRSLGASCEIVNEGTDNETCVSSNVNDVNSPIVDPMTDVFRGDFTIDEVTEEGNKGYELNELVPAFTPVNLGIVTDEPAQCKYSTTPGTAYDDMNSYFGSSIYEYNHSVLLSLGDEITEEEVVALTEGVYTLYIKCSDARGNNNEDDYFIRFEVDTTPDLTPPEVIYTSLADGSYMPFNVSETSFTIYINEPAQCKWNMNDTGYEFMNYDMSCTTSGYAQSSYYYGTYPCSTTLTGLTDDTINYYYFRCMDNSENFNEDSYKLTLKATEDILEIIEVSPSDALYDDDVVLTIETEGGADDDSAVCGFSPEDVEYSRMIEFAETNGSEHSQSLSLVEGSYEYYFGCMDVAGNLAYNSTSFTLEVDTDAPLITTLYIDTIYSVLYLEMDEASTCEYAGEDFVYGEGASMTGTNSTYHEASLDRFLYYIECVDQYGNYGDYIVDTTFWV